MDYAAWTKRASTFLRGLTFLPGEIEVQEWIEPAGTDEFTQEWLISKKCTLPPELRQFIATASKRCILHYRWKPPTQWRDGLAEVFPDCVELLGGADLCEASRFHNYDNRQWFEEDLPPMMEKAALDVIKLFPPEFANLLNANAPMDFLLNAVKDDERDLGRIPLLILKSEAKICLCLDKQNGARPVAYVDPKEPARAHILSESFDNFLLSWEQLCYISPSLVNLTPWLDPSTGYLNPDNDKAVLLRKALMTAAQHGKE